MWEYDYKKKTIENMWEFDYKTKNDWKLNEVIRLGTFKKIKGNKV